MPRDWSVEQTYFAITIILALIGWTTLAREVRSRFLSLREEDYVVAAKLSGAEGSARGLSPYDAHHVQPYHRLGDAGHTGDDYQRNFFEFPGAWPAAAGYQLGGAAAGSAKPAVNRPGALAAAARLGGDHYGVDDESHG